MEIHARLSWHNAYSKFIIDANMVQNVSFKMHYLFLAMTKARYSLTVLKVPLNPNQSINFPGKRITDKMPRNLPYFVSTRPTFH